MSARVVEMTEPESASHLSGPIHLKNPAVLGYSVRNSVSASARNVQFHLSDERCRLLLRFQGPA